MKYACSGPSMGPEEGNPATTRTSQIRIGFGFAEVSFALGAAEVSGFCRLLATMPGFLQPGGAIVVVDKEVTPAREHRPLLAGPDGPQPYQGRPSAGPVPPYAARARHPFAQ